MEATGKLHFVGDTKQVSDKFKNREFVLAISDNPEYIDHVKFEFKQDKVALLDKFSLGQVVTVGYNLKGREYTSKTTGVVGYFNTLDAWKINAEAGGTPEYSKAVDISGDDDLGLPF
jgi:hypothetical protein